MDSFAFSESLLEAIDVAKSIAKEYMNATFSAPHLLRALFNENAGLHSLLKSMDKNIFYCIDWTDLRIAAYPKSTQIPDNIGADERAVSSFEAAENISLKLGLNKITPACLLAAVLQQNIGFSSDQLKSLPLTGDEVFKKIVAGTLLNDAVSSVSSESTGAAKIKKNLLKYCKDMTQHARETKAAPVVGRDRELRVAFEILGRRTKRNVLIVGEAGVGKSTLARGIAITIASERMPPALQNAHLYELDLSLLFAGVSYKGELEERLKNVLAEAKEIPNTILFIDEIHTLANAAGTGGSVFNLLKAEFADNSVVLIGATTNSEFNKSIESDKAFLRHFELLKLEEPDTETAIRMMEQTLPQFENHHNLKIEDGVLPECVLLAKRYLKEMMLPDASIDLLDRTMASVNWMNQTSGEEITKLRSKITAIKNTNTATAVKLSEYRWITRAMNDSLSPVLLGILQDVSDTSKFTSSEQFEKYLDVSLEKLAQYASQQTALVTKYELAAVTAHRVGIPIGKISAREQKKLSELEDIINARVIGQNHAVKMVADAINLSRGGLANPGQPIASLFFVGPTGTGKTELSKAIAQFLFDNETSMIRFDMSEFKEAHSAALLLGAPPGYVGYEEGGKLVKAIRKQPYSVVLFDEIEKAHPDVFDIFLQVMGEGKLHDRLGNEGDFSNALIIFTSNISSEWIAEQFTKGIIPESSDVIKMMKKHFRPEFLGRYLQIVPFAPISERNIVSILEIQMKHLVANLNNKNIGFTINEPARKKIAISGFTAEYGAREIGSAVRNHLTVPLSRLIVSGKLAAGNNVEVVTDDLDNILINVINTENVMLT